MKIGNLVYKSFGESAILIEWPKEINEELLNDIRTFSKAIKVSNITGLIDCNFVYHSMVITFVNESIKSNELISRLKELYSKKNTLKKAAIKTWFIPVCYGLEFGLDMQEFLSIKDMSLKELIAHHTSPVYTVFGIGFLPGFLYLGGLSDKLITPRKSNPRLDVKKGAVAIGGNQTGIYPQNSPGGWHIIGKTPISLFNAKNDTPCFISVGDKIQFYSISKSEYELVELQVAAEIFDFKKRIND